jgi:hypothetical protein
MRETETETERLATNGTMKKICESLNLSESLFSFSHKTDG